MLKDMSRYFTKGELLRNNFFFYPHLRNINVRETHRLQRNNFDKLFTITLGIVKENLSEMPFLQTKLIQVVKYGNAD